jgi:hypothetical protein
MSSIIGSNGLICTSTDVINYFTLVINVIFGKLYYSGSFWFKGREGNLFNSILLLLKLIQAKFLFDWIIEQNQIGQRKFAMCTITKNDRCATIGQRKKYRQISITRAKKLLSRTS